MTKCKRASQVTCLGEKILACKHETQSFRSPWQIKKEDVHRTQDNEWQITFYELFGLLSSKNDPNDQARKWWKATPYTSENRLSKQKSSKKKTYPFPLGSQNHGSVERYNECRAECEHRARYLHAAGRFHRHWISSRTCFKRLVLQHRIQFNILKPQVTQVRNRKRILLLLQVGIQDEFKESFFIPHTLLLQL